jgi:hypothetical protein
MGAEMEAAFAAGERQSAVPRPTDSGFKSGERKRKEEKLGFMRKQEENAIEMM